MRHEIMLVIVLVVVGYRQEKIHGHDFWGECYRAVDEWFHWRGFSSSFITLLHYQLVDLLVVSVSVCSVNYLMTGRSLVRSLFIEQTICYMLSYLISVSHREC
jgi:hypothetical protein